MILAANGIQHQTIGRTLGIDHKTLEKHFRLELDCGLDQVKALISGGLTRAALNGNTTAQIFWLKAMGGWRDRPAPGFGGDDPTNPINPEGQVVVYLPDNGRGDVDAGIVEVEVGRGA